MAALAKPTNGFDGAVLKDFIARVETIEDEIASDMGAALSAAKVKRSEISDVIVEARESGIPSKALKLELALRKKDREKARLSVHADEATRETHEEMRAALGDLASLPLGVAAVRQAKARAA
jgi:uncharacterized protein (UPF0335 family)